MLFLSKIDQDLNMPKSWLPLNDLTNSSQDRYYSSTEYRPNMHQFSALYAFLSN